jgi:hypothetical protein
MDFEIQTPEIADVQEFKSEFCQIFRATRTTEDNDDFSTALLLGPVKLEPVLHLEMRTANEESPLPAQKNSFRHLFLIFATIQSGTQSNVQPLCHTLAPTRITLHPLRKSFQRFAAVGRQRTELNSYFPSMNVTYDSGGDDRCPVGKIEENGKFRGGRRSFAALSKQATETYILCTAQYLFVSVMDLDRRRQRKARIRSRRRVLRFRWSVRHVLATFYFLSGDLVPGALTGADTIFHELNRD